MDCSPPGSYVRKISQARILEWVAISFAQGSSWPRDWTRTSALAGGFFTTEPPKTSLKQKDNEIEATHAANCYKTQDS